MNSTACVEGSVRVAAHPGAAEFAVRRGSGAALTLGCCWQSVLKAAGPVSSSICCARMGFTSRAPAREFCAATRRAWPCSRSRMRRWRALVGPPCKPLTVRFRPSTQHDNHPRRPPPRRPRPAPESALRHRRHPVACPRNWRKYGDFHAGRPDSPAEAAGRRARSAGHALPGRAAQRQQHGQPDALLPDLPGHAAAGRAAGGSVVPSAGCRRLRASTTAPSGSTPRSSLATSSRCSG